MQIESAMIRFRDGSTHAKLTPRFGILLFMAILMIRMVAGQIHSIDQAVKLNQDSANSSQT